MSGCPPASADAKRALRQSVIAARDAIPPDARRALSAAICRRVAESDEFRGARCVLLFAGFGSEVDTRGLIDAALAAGKRVALPRVDPATRALELREVSDPDTDLAPGTWGIPEPLPDRCPEVEASDIDFVLVPGVAFDRTCGRLGYGGGYYDRLLAGLPEGAAAIAVCFGQQIVDRVPADAHDFRVPIIITEAERIEAP